jgi:hypothetical protein
MKTIYDIDIDTTAWMVMHRDNSDHGEARVLFNTEEEARDYARDLLVSPQGNALHPAPNGLGLRVFRIERSPIYETAECDDLTFLARVVFSGHLPGDRTEFERLARIAGMEKTGTNSYRPRATA